MPHRVMPYFRGLSDEFSCVAIQQQEDVTPKTTQKHKVSLPPPPLPAAACSDTPLQKCSLPDSPLLSVPSLDRLLPFESLDVGTLRLLPPTASCS